MVKPNTDSDSRPPHSDPPAVKRERVRVDGAIKALGMCLAAATDWAAVILATYALSQRWISQEIWTLLVVGAGAGTIAGKLTGRGGGSSTAWVVGFAPVAKAAIVGALGIGRHMQ